MTRKSTEARVKQRSSAHIAASEIIRPLSNHAGARITASRLLSHRLSIRVVSSACVNSPRGKAKQSNVALGRCLLHPRLEESCVKGAAHAHSSTPRLRVNCARHG